MNKQNTLEQLKCPKLIGFAKRYEAALSLPIHEQEDVHSLIAMLTQAEEEHRYYYRIQKYLKANKLRYYALPEATICNT
jgi:hypothetical protein